MRQGLPYQKSSRLVSSSWPHIPVPHRKSYYQSGGRTEREVYYQSGYVYIWKSLLSL